MKRCISLILSIALLLSFAPTGLFSITASAATSGYYTYTTSDSKAKITDVSDTISGEITIPSTLGGYPVVEIDYQAFKDCVNVISIVVPDSVITIDISAFAGCTGLTDITIGSGVTSVSSSAFSGCTNLSGIWVNVSNTAYSNDEKGVLFNKDKTTIISAPKAIQSYAIPYGVINIGYSAFSECSNLTSLSLPDSLLSIGGSAFADCTNISGITIPESVVSIDDAAFSGCSNLASISIPSKVTSIGEGVFKGCSSLSGIWVDANNPIYCNDTQGVLFNKNKTTLIQAPGTIQSYTVPYGVTEIFDSAFEDCTALTSLTLSSSVLCIGPFAFNGCTNLKYNTYSNCRYLGTSSNSYFALIEEATTLTSCTIHSNTKIIADYAIFSYYLTSVTIPNGVIRIGSNAFSSAMNLKSVSIPSSVISFGSDMFSSLADNLSYTTYGSGKYLGNSSNPYLVLIGTTSTSITSFSIHKNTKAIANEAFQYCNSLTSVTIPEGVTSIGDWAFYSCDKLSNVTIPDTVTEIGTLAFSDCGSLSSITIPDSVVRIGDHAFSDCGNLTGIWVEESNPSFCSDEKGVLFNKNKTLLIQAPGEISGSYCIPNGVVNIGDSAFDSCYNLSSITIPDSVTKIGTSAFSYCYYIKNVWYMGSQSSKEHNLMVGTGNDYLNRATWHYESCIEKDTHTYVDCEDLVCDVCGMSRESSHTYEWVTDHESNCIYTGIKHEECSVCHVKRNENTIIPVTGIHTFTDVNDTECDVCNEAFYQITFNSNGGTTIPTIVILPGETASIPTDIPTRNGYVFDSWSFTKNGDADYQPGALLSAIDKSMVLYAQWNKICTTCKGDGIEDYSVKCTYCNGKGTVTSSTSCSTCSGDGKIESTTSVTCTLCNGTGKGDIHDAACGFCAGYGGYFTYKCSSGHSMMSKYRLYSCSTCGSYSITETIHTCSTCGGYGTVKSDKCKVCDGKGSTSEQNSTTCYMCSGSGYANADCSHCVGGYIDKTRSCTACNATGEVIRKSTSAPSAPVVKSYDETIVILQGISNGEYSIDGVNWQESPTFEGLVGGQEYTFYQRYAKTDTTLRSSASVGLTITTQHVYDNDCDTTCNGCGYVRTVSNHVYDNDCDATCNVCSVIREVPHFYDMACDTTCNECGATRTVPHLYDDESDPICNLCGHNRAKTSGKTGNCDWYVIDTTLYITGNGTMDSYSSTGPWGSSITKAVIKEGVTTVGKYAFYNCTKLTSVTIPDSVTSIGSYAFAYCSGLPAITIGNGVTKIDSKAFYNCTSLASITIPGNVTSIGSDAFYNCYALNAVYISNLKAWCEIDYADYDDNPLYRAGNLYLNGVKITDLIIPDGTTVIKKYVFASFDSLTSVTIPDSVITVSDYAFYYNTNLSSVTIGKGVTSIGSYAFYNCTKLTSVTIPDNVTSVGSYAFAYCSGLANVNIGDGVTQIGSRAFYNDTSLSTIIIGDGLTNIATYAFYGCYNLNDVWYKGSSQSNISISSNNTPLTSANWHCNVDVVGEHLYDSVCDIICNICGDIRSVPHVYDNVCDATCNVCGSTRTVPDHAYDNACDSTCNSCGMVRVVPDHVYDDENDRECNECGFITYTVGDIDGDQAVTQDDAVYLLLHTMFGEAFYPLNNAPADIDNNGTVNQDDAVYLLLHSMFGEMFYPLNPAILPAKVKEQ